MITSHERSRRWARGPLVARRAPYAVTLLVAIILLGGPLAFGITWSLDIAAWLMLAMTFTVVGAAVVSRVPDNLFGWALLSIAVTSAITVSSVGEDVPGFVAWLRSWIAFVPICLLPIALLVFPTGRLPSDRWRPALALAVAGVSAPAFFLAVASAVEPDPLGLFGPGGGSRAHGLVVAARVGGVVAALALALGVLSLAQRVRRASDFERRQVLCLLLGATALLGCLLLEAAGLTGAWVAGAAALPVSAGVAILWHRLYDLDLFINRSLVYAGLSVALLAAFGAIVLLGNLLANHVAPDGTWTLVAVALVALGLDPLRRRLQRGVDRLFYGSRDDPYAVVTALGRGLGSSDDAPTMLTDVAASVARSLALPYVAIETRQQDGALAEWGRRRGEAIALPLTYRGEDIGRLLATPRTVGGRLSEKDRGLLADIAHPVALAVNAVELSAGLQRAREQLVTTREEERRRLRRDLHDGLGPTLAGMVMQLDAASNLLRRDPSAVEPVLAGLRTAAQDAVADIRRLVYELRPPALDELGLVGAISESLERFNGHGADGLMLSLDAPARLPVLPAAVEVATLRIVQEAVANVARHSHAHSCVVRIACDGAVLAHPGGALVVDIRDDGHGLPDDLRPGVGLGSMRERAAEVGGSCTITSPNGGGAHVHAVLPLSS